MNHKVFLKLIFVQFVLMLQTLIAQESNFQDKFVEIKKDTLGNQYHYYISKYAVSVQDYQGYLQFMGLKLPQPPPEYGWENKALPMVAVSYSDVLSYCYWMSDVYQINFRVPTEMEWVMAWDRGQKKLANSKERPLCVDCPKPNSKGVYGMNGNVWEWTSSLLENEYNIIKGGSYTDELGKNSKENTAALSPDLEITDVGFRLVVDAKEMKKFLFADKVEKLLFKLFPEYTNIGVEPHVLYLNDGAISWKQKGDIVKIDFKELQLKFCCMEYNTDLKNNSEPKTIPFYFAEDQLNIVKELEKLINNRDLSLFE